MPRSMYSSPNHSYTPTKITVDLPQETYIKSRIPSVRSPQRSGSPLPLDNLPSSTPYVTPSWMGDDMAGALNSLRRSNSLANSEDGTSSSMGNAMLAKPKRPPPPPPKSTTTSSYKVSPSESQIFQLQPETSERAPTPPRTSVNGISNPITIPSTTSRPSPGPKPKQLDDSPAPLPRPKPAHLDSSPRASPILRSQTQLEDSPVPAPRPKPVHLQDSPRIGSSPRSKPRLEDSPTSAPALRPKPAYLEGSPRGSPQLRPKHTQVEDSPVLAPLLDFPLFPLESPVSQLQPLTVEQAPTLPHTSVDVISSPPIIASLQSPELKIERLDDSPAPTPRLKPAQLDSSPPASPITSAQTQLEDSPAPALRPRPEHLQDSPRISSNPRSIPLLEDSPASAPAPRLQPGHPEGSPRGSPQIRPKPTGVEDSPVQAPLLDFPFSPSEPPVSQLQPQPFMHDSTQLAQVAQHSNPSADSLHFAEQLQLQPSANGISSSPSRALEAPPSPSLASQVQPQPFVEDSTQLAPVSQHSSPPADSLPLPDQPQLQSSANGVTSSPSPALISQVLPQTLEHDSAQLAPVAQHSNPSTDSLPIAEQPQLQSSANGVASSLSPALEAPNIASTPTTHADSPKTPKTPKLPVIASEVPIKEPDEEDDLGDDLQRATNVDSLSQSDDVNQALTKSECEDCQRYKEELLQKNIQIRALSDQNNFLSQKLRKRARLLPQLFASKNKTNSTALAGSEICESKPEANTLSPSAEDLNTESGCRCVIQ